MSISCILLLLGIGILLFSLLFKYSNFLDIRTIIVQHLKIFKGNRIQLVGVFIAPIFISIGLIQIKCIDKDIIANLNIILSLLISMFLSILSILCSFDRKVDNVNYKRLLKETYNTTIFEIILCLMLLFVSFVVLFIGDFKETIQLKITSGAIYYLTMIMILNILVVIKRIKVLFDNQ